MNILSQLRIQNSIDIHDRGDDRISPDSGLSLYVNNGELRAVDDQGALGLPVDTVVYTPQDVTAISSPSEGMVAYNDGTTGTAGPAHYNGTDWISTVDGTTIA
jgi:hypothetical protein